MTDEQKNPSTMHEHEKKNEGGSESGRVFEPSQAQQASRSQGLAGNMMDSKQQNAPGHQQTSSGSHQGSSQQHSSSEHSGSGSQQQGSGSQRGRPPGNVSQEHSKERQGEKKSA